MDAPPDPDTQLRARLATRDVRGAATLLIERYADEVFGLCRAMVRDTTAAEDLTQDVFARAFAALAGYRGDASVRTWILRIARNRCIDHIRARSRQPWNPGDEVSPDDQPAEEPRVDDLLTRRADLERGLDALSENERAMIVLRFGHELEYAELARAFGLGSGAVRMRISRAVAKMRRAILEVPAQVAMPASAAAPPAPSVGRARRAVAPAPQAPPPSPAGPASPPPPAAAPAPGPAPIPRAPRPVASPLRAFAPVPLRQRLGALLQGL